MNRYGEHESETQAAFRQYQIKQPALSGDEVEELAEVGVTDAVILWRTWEGPCCHLYLSAMVNGAQKFGWWPDFLSQVFVTRPAVTFIVCHVSQGQEQEQLCPFCISFFPNFGHQFYAHSSLRKSLNL